MAQCLQLCLDTSDSQENCFGAFCCGLSAELCNRCAQPPALHITAFPASAGPGGCTNNRTEILQSSLGLSDVSPAAFEPVVPPVQWHPLFPSPSAGCCSQGKNTGLEISCRSRVGDSGSAGHGQGFSESLTMFTCLSQVIRMPLAFAALNF